MVKIKTDIHGQPLPCEIYCDGYLHDNLKALGEYVKRKWDSIGFICGYEGDGKSILAQQLALLLDATFAVERIVFTPEQFEEAVNHAKPGQAIVWDEADDLGAGFYTDLLHALKRKFKQIRKKRLHIILVTPTIFDLNKYFVIGRTRYLLHVYAEGFERGYFRFFNRDQKKKLYLKGYRDWDWKAAGPNFIGRFTDIPDGFPVDQDAYEEKKDETMENIIANLNDRGSRKSKRELLKDYRREILPRLTRWLESNGYGYRHKDLAAVFDVDRSLISSDLRELAGDEADEDVSGEGRREIHAET